MNKGYLILTLTAALMGLAHDASGSYNPATGRWLSRDPMEQRGGRNLYAFANNNPINRTDTLGLWPEVVHHEIIDDWLSDSIYDRFYWRCCERIPVRALLKDGSDQVDGVGAHSGNFLDAHTPANAYQHAMSEEGEPVFVAEARYNHFIQDNLDEARRLSDRARGLSCASAPAGVLYEAVRRVGAAVHAFADNMCPPHSGFQVSHMSWDINDITSHLARESMSVYIPMKSDIVAAIESPFMPFVDYVLAIRIE